MGKITTVGIDLAKSVFSVHAVDENGSVLVRKTVNRSRLTAMVAQWARAALQMAARRNDKLSRWALAVKARCGYHKAVVALAAKNARIIWALLARGTTFTPA